MTKVVLLDDIGLASYKKLKKLSDELMKVQASLTKKRAHSKGLLEHWLYLEKMELEPEADAAYNMKHNLDYEISNLQAEEKTLVQRIKTYVK